ncbi:MAG: hypothetical protein ACE5KO_00795 [Candidatus Bathyarchaeia archaeon]
MTKDSIIHEINRILYSMNEKELLHVRAIIRQEFKLHEMEEQTLEEPHLDEEPSSPDKVKSRRTKRKSEHTKGLHSEP